jgi:hypothetical protein
MGPFWLTSQRLKSANNWSLNWWAETAPTRPVGREWSRAISPSHPMGKEVKCTTKWPIVQEVKTTRMATSRRWSHSRFPMLPSSVYRQRMSISSTLASLTITWRRNSSRHRSRKLVVSLTFQSKVWVTRTRGTCWWIT